MTLQCDRGRFYRVKPGQTAREVEDFLLCPACGCFAGEIIAVSPCKPHILRPFETYASLAEENGLTEERLRSFNRNALPYPSRKIYIPL